MLLYEKAGNIGILTINRPEALNALNSALLDCLYEKVTEIAHDTELRCLIVTGAGKAFVAGADISEMKDLSRPEAFAFGMHGHKAFCALENLAVPVIAAVNGYALGGGCELSLCADIRIASEKAKFGQPEVGLGIIPGFGGTQRLTRTVNRAYAADLILSARTVSAAEALQMGLVSRVVPPEELMNGAIAMAKSFTANAPIAVKYSKACIDRGMQMDIDDGIALENELFAMCFATEDQKEGMGAFLEKRKEKHFIGK